MARRSLQASSEGTTTLKVALKRRKWSQTYLAGVAGCSRQTIWSLFHGNPIDAEVFLTICTQLGLSEYEVAEAEEKSVEGLELDELVTQVRCKIKARMHEQCGFMNVLSMTKPIGLGDIYTDVNILETIAGRRRLGLENLENFQAEHLERFGYSSFRKKEERLPGLEAVERCKKMVVLGQPGAGKTTFLKRIATQCNGGSFHPELVPIFVPLKQFAETEGHPKLLAYIANQWAESKVKEAESKAEKLLHEGRALVLLDGFDEVLRADSSRIIEDIRQFSERFHSNLHVLTCRIATHEFKLESFTEVEIADFDDQQIAVFVTKWFGPKNPERTEAFLHKLKESPRIRELATKPLLLTLLCLSFEESGYFSGSRTALYKEGLYILLKGWDAKKPGLPNEDVYRQLTPDRKEDLLSQLAYETFDQGQYVFSEEIAKQQISRYIINLPSADNNTAKLDSDSEVVLKSIEGQHGLLVSRAHWIYSFSHLTFHEYFTARKIEASCNPYSLKDKALQQLVQRTTNKRWREIFLLVAEMLPSADCFLQLMKHHIDELVKQDQTLQKVLGWAQKKALSVKTSYKPAAVRAFYLYRSPPPLARALDPDRDHALDRELNRALDRARARALDRPLALAHELALDRDHELALAVELDLDLNFALEPARELALDLELTRALSRALFLELEPDLELTSAFSLALELAIERALDPKFLQVLQDFQAQLPDPEQNFSAFKIWWKTQGQSWAEALRSAMIQYRNIGHDWSFTSDQIALLQQYLIANLLLVNCLNSNCYVSRNVRAEIEKTLLLPMAEIEARSVQ